MIISENVENIFDKIHHCFITKHSDLVTEKSYLNQVVWEKSIANIITNREKWGKKFLFRTKARMSTFATLLCNEVLEVLATGARPEAGKENEWSS